MKTLRAFSVVLLLAFLMAGLNAQENVGQTPPPPQGMNQQGMDQRHPMSRMNPQMREQMQARAQEMNLTNVTFIDSIPKSEMSSALAAADACIAILKPLEEYKTTYPNKVFDTMAAGRPLALAIDGVIREVVEAAGCGLFAAPGDPSALSEAIRALASDEKKSRQMGLAGRNYLEENFSRAAIGEKLIALLEKL